MQTSIRTWALPALCAMLYALFSAIVLFVLSPDGSPILRAILQPRSAVQPLGALALAAGACTVIAALSYARKGSRWLLALNGLACGALGLLVVLGATRPVAFRTIASLIVVMAVSLCLYELAGARAQRGQPRAHGADQWLLGAAALVSLSFAAAFLAFALRWFPLAPSPSAQTFHWLGSYFAFSAVCMLSLAYTSRPAFHGIASSALPTS